jgi:tripartite-type tricarboxylate transporter receptor subunit TctC
MRFQKETSEEKLEGPMWNTRARVVGIASLIAAVVCVIPVYAQDYPNQPIKVIIPNPPGGPGDIIARAFTDKATQIVGKPFVYDYRPGGSTTIGTASAAKAEPDGYTIVGFPSAGVGAAAIKKKLSYNLETDFRPIAGLGTVPLVLVVRAGLNLTSMDEFSAALRKGNLVFGSAGVGTIGHLTSLLLQNELKGTATHVPFRSTLDTLQNVMGGHVDFCFVSAADVTPFAVAKEVKFLATTAGRRLRDLPDIPTTTEVGLPNISSKFWYAFLAPSKTSADVIARLYDAFAEAGKDQDLQKQVKNLGFDVEIRNPDETAKVIRDEIARWKKVIEVSNIPLEN